MTTADTINISKHPIVAQKLSQLREKNQSPKVVRELTSDLSFLLGYEASADVTLKKGQMASNIYIQIRNVLYIYIYINIACIYRLLVNMAIINPMR